MRSRTTPFAVCALMLLGVPLATLCAQTPDSLSRASNMLTVGIGYSSGGSMMMDPAENWKVKPVHAWRATVDASYPLTNTIGAWLSIGLDRRGSDFAWFNDATLIERRMVNYFSITPGVNLKGIVFGLNIGFPTGGTRTYWNGFGTRERTIELDGTRDKLAVMVEPRLFGVIRVLDETFGTGSIVIGAGYNLGDMSERRDFMPGEKIGTTYSSNTVSLHAGVTFQAAIPGTARQ